MNYKQLSSKVFFCLVILVAIDYLPAYAQEEQKKTKVTIIKESYDEEGNKTVQKIVKEGAEADAIDIERLAEGELGPFDFQMPEGKGWLDIRSLMDSLDFGDLQLKGFGDWPSMEGFGSFGAPKARLGVKIKALEMQSGVLVTEVMPDSPAQRAGVAEGDIIRSVDGEEINDPQELVNYLNNGANDQIELDILRDERALVLTAVLSVAREEDELPTRKL
ncbi:MAG: PDZ domain-containing protein [Saprospiraceae bacterium]|nr:PDZ domain-containing protein [Saprospiraceae bacterium]